MGKPSDVICWDVRSAVRTRADEAQYLAGYTSIDAVFDDRRLFVCQAETVARTPFDFSDPRHWLAVPLDGEALEELRIYPVCRQPPFSDLRPRTWGLPIDAPTIEEAIERRIEEQVRLHREAAGLPTTFNSHLSQLLHVALVNYELERLGITRQTSLFESLILRVCAADHVFRAVPVQFNHLRVSLFWPTLSDRPAAREVLAVPAPGEVAVRARVVAYPEGAVAAWILIAAIDA